MRAGKPIFSPHNRAGWAMGAALLLLLVAPGSRAQQTDSTAAAPKTPAASAAAQESQAPAEETPVRKKHKWIQRDDSVDNGKSTAPTPAKPVRETRAAAKPEKVSKPHVAKEERVVQTKDTRAELRREKKYNPLIGKDVDLPDKQLYDKGLLEEKKGHFDVARLDLQTLLNTYPDSQYLMRAKLAVADSWFQEGGSAALAQAEQEYNDFITFFPNVPEAGEAQMRMGDIYLKQMDVPDRDYAKAIKAEEQYRVMLKTYPDAPPAVRKEAEQKLRDVQEVLAQREFDLGQFYAQRGNIAAAIARYQTVADTYPLFSHMDDVLIGLGDAYEADANSTRGQVACSKTVRTGCLPEAAKSALEQEYDGRAAKYYRDVVLHHSAAPHAEDAKERLQAMNLPLPTPTAAEVAASDALEGSRAQYTMQKRLELMFMRKPDTVTAAQIGVPPLEDPALTTAPAVMKEFNDEYAAALNPAAAKHAAPARTATTTETSPSEAPAEPSPAPGASTPLTLSDVPTAGNTTGDTGNVTETTPADTATPASGERMGNGGASLGVDVLTPGAVAPGSTTGAPIGDRASDLPSATGKRDPNYGLVAPKPASATVALPAAEAPAAAPDAINEVQGKPQPAAEQKNANKKKNPRPGFDKNDESSSKHKKKKGLDKVNPF